MLVRVRGVAELAQLARDDIGRLLGDVDGVVGDALERSSGQHHAQAPFAPRMVAADCEHLLHDGAVEIVDEVVELHRAAAPARHRGA